MVDDGDGLLDAAIEVLATLCDRMNRVPEASMAYDRWNDCYDTTKLLVKQIKAGLVMEAVVKIRKEIDDGYMLDQLKNDIDITE